MSEKVIVGCIKSMDHETIQAKFYLFVRNEKRVADITRPLFSVIRDYNREAKQKSKEEAYQLIIPFELEGELITYAFGCGLSHYFQKSNFDKLKPFEKRLGLSFDTCDLAMLTPSDLKMYGLHGIDDPELINVCLNYL